MFYPFMKFKGTVIDWSSFHYFLTFWQCDDIDRHKLICCSSTKYEMQFMQGRNMVTVNFKRDGILLPGNKSFRAAKFND